MKKGHGIKHLLESLESETGEVSLGYDENNEMLFVKIQKQPVQCFTHVDKESYFALLRCMASPQLKRLVMRDRPPGEWRPHRLFKYMRCQHAGDFLDGKVLVSPAIRFQKDISENLSLGQTDREYVKKVEFNTHGTIEGVEHVPDIPFGHCCISDDRQSLTLVAQPYWLWCSSIVRDVALFGERNFDCDACVEITDVGDFGERLMAVAKAALGVSASWAGLIDYSSHEDLIGYGRCGFTLSHPSFLKNREYEHQCEFRFVWTGLKDTPLNSEVRSGRLLDMGSNRHCAQLITM